MTEEEKEEDEEEERFRFQCADWTAVECAVIGGPFRGRCWTVR